MLQNTRIYLLLDTWLTKQFECEDPLGPQTGTYTFLIESLHAPQ